MVGIVHPEVWEGGIPWCICHLPYGRYTLVYIYTLPYHPGYTMVYTSVLYSALATGAAACGVQQRGPGL